MVFFMPLYMHAMALVCNESLPMRNTSHRMLQPKKTVCSNKCDINNLISSSLSTNRSDVPKREAIKLKLLRDDQCHWNFSHFRCSTSSSHFSWMSFGVYTFHMQVPLIKLPNSRSWFVIIFHCAWITWNAYRASSCYKQIMCIHRIA